MLFIIFFIIFSCKSNKQVNEKTVVQKEINYIPYYLKMYKADSLYLINDFEGSYKILDSLFKVFEPLNSDNYAEYGVYLNCAVKSNHLDSIREKVIYGYLHFGNIQTLHKDSYVMYKAVNKAANLSDKEMKDLKMKYYNSLNLDLRKRLLKAYTDDQEVRIENRNNESEGIVDGRTLKLLEETFKNGFPNKNVLGWNNAYDTPDKGRIDFDILLAHQPDSIKKIYLPIFLEGIKKGKSEPWIYAFIHDRMMMDNYKKQTYGTFRCNDGKLCECINAKKIDSIRESIGLSNLNYYPWKLKKIQEE